MSPPNKSPEVPDDASIPMLTERLTLPPLELDTTLPLEPQTPTPTSAPTVPFALDTSLALGLPQAPPPARAAPAPSKPASASSSKPATVPATQTGASAASTSVHWTRVELELRASILQSIADSLPEQIDNIVRRRMNDAIERLFVQLVAETRLAVAASLRDIVDQAVRAELARLRGGKR